MTTPSSRMILDKPKIEVTKVLTHTNGKNGEHFYAENWHNNTKNGENSDYNSRLVTKNLMHHAGRNGGGGIPVYLSTSATPHVDSCSRKLIGEGNTQSTLWLTGKGMKLIQLDTTSLKWIGELFMTQVSSFSW